MVAWPPPFSFRLLRRFLSPFGSSLLEPSRFLLLFLTSFSPAGGLSAGAFASSSFVPPSSSTTTSASGPFCSSCSTLGAMGSTSGASTPAARSAVTWRTSAPEVSRSRSSTGPASSARSSSAPAAPRRASTTADSCDLSNRFPCKISRILRSVRHAPHKGPPKSPQEEQDIEA